MRRFNPWILIPIAAGLLAHLTVTVARHLRDQLAPVLEDVLRASR